MSNFIILIFVMINANKTTIIILESFFSHNFCFIKVIRFLKMDKNKCPKTKI